ncbi:MAG: SagB family peptide dehydrogenase [Acidobacteriota bacterium]|nr:SagB family peptide dehydrogenase [Acidobacteriota bacterium]
MLETPDGELAFDGAGPAVVGVFARLCERGMTAAACAEEVLAGEGMSGLLRFEYFLLLLFERGLISWSLDHPAVSLTPENALFRPEENVFSGPLCLSRFAYCRPEQGNLVWRNPLVPASLAFHDAASAALPGEFARPRSADEAPKGYTAEEWTAFIGLARNAGILVDPSEEEDPHARTWEAHDLIFHNQARESRRGDSGGTFRFKGVFPAPPAEKPPVSPIRDPIPLARPDLAVAEYRDPPFPRVMEERKTVRRYGAEPISLDDLAHLLYRSARSRCHIEQPHQDLLDRPYPGGGAIYELEVYVAAKRVVGLAPGFYHYDAMEHRLCLLAEPNGSLQALLQHFRDATGIPEIQCGLVISSRMSRLAWKYQRIAYSITLKNAGVLLQTLYLNAHALDLAPCGVGSGNPDLFADLTGLNPFEETSVAEFLVGSMPP